jgi:hypothetical protein
MEPWAKPDLPQEITSTSKESLHENILAQLDEIRRNFEEFWDEYGPELTADDLAEIHQMFRELELRMLVKFCNRLGE